jgi:hypothetical protein
MTTWLMLLTVYFAAGLLVGGAAVDKLKLFGVDYFVNNFEHRHGHRFSEQKKEFLRKHMALLVLLASMFIGVPAVLYTLMKKR